MRDNEVNPVPSKTSRALVYVLPKFVVTHKWERRVVLQEKGVAEGGVPYEKINGAERF